MLDDGTGANERERVELAGAEIRRLRSECRDIRCCDLRDRIAIAEEERDEARGEVTRLRDECSRLHDVAIGHQRHREMAEERERRERDEALTAIHKPRSSASAGTMYARAVRMICGWLDPQRLAEMTDEARAEWIALHGSGLVNESRAAGGLLSLAKEADAARNEAQEQGARWMIEAYSRTAGIGEPEDVRASIAARTCAEARAKGGE